MKNFSHLKSIKNCPLFSGLEETEINALLECLGAEAISCPKEDFIFSAGETLRRIGVVLSGGVNILREDFWGGRAILTHMGPGDLFGEAFACAGVEKFPVSAAAAEASEILLLDYKKMLAPCGKTCAFHSKLIGNLLRILARRNVLLVQKMEHLTRRSTREKLLSYLSAQARQAGKNIFRIPFNRQELADYLSVDRSAMSAELSKMRTEGVLDFKRNEFELFKLE